MIPSFPGSNILKSVAIATDSQISSFRMPSIFGGVLILDAVIFFFSCAKTVEVIINNKEIKIDLYMFNYN